MSLLRKVPPKRFSSQKLKVLSAKQWDIVLPVAHHTSIHICRLCFNACETRRKGIEPSDQPSTTNVTQQARTIPRHSAEREQGQIASPMATRNGGRRQHPRRYIDKLDDTPDHEICVKLKEYIRMYIATYITPQRETFCRRRCCTGDLVVTKTPQPFGRSGKFQISCNMCRITKGYVVNAEQSTKSIIAMAASETMNGTACTVLTVVACVSHALVACCSHSSINA